MSIADKLTTIAENEQKVYEAGYEKGHEAGYEKGHEAGKKSEYDAFWDAYQQNGERWNYSYAFAYIWDNKLFRPKYDIKLGGGYSSTQMFWNNTVDDVPAVLEELGLTLDTSNCQSFIQTFQSSRSIRWGVIDMRKAYSTNYAFGGCKAETIEKLILSNTVPFQNMFDTCTALTSLTIEGTIGQNGLNLSWSPLNKASLTSVVNALSSTTSGLTVTLRLAAVNTAFETSAGAADGSTSDEWLALVATRSNWTISLV